MLRHSSSINTETMWSSMFSDVFLSRWSLTLFCCCRCCLRFGATANDFIFDAIIDRMWEIAQGRFGARSMRACLESPHITLSQQRRVATSIVLNSIPLATNPNGALLLTWFLDTSNFPFRYNLLAPRFTPHLSHLCTHKLASLTVLRIVNQKIEPDASAQVVDALFASPGDHVLTDVLGDQVNGVAVVHKILTSPFIDATKKSEYIDATKRVLIELKVIATQAYRKLIEEVGLPVPNFQPAYAANVPQTGKKITPQGNYGMPGLPSGYPSNDQGLASVMAALQMGGQNPQSGPPQLHIDPTFGQGPPRSRGTNVPPPYPPAPGPELFSPFAMRANEAPSPKGGMRRNGGMPAPSPSYGNPSPTIPPAGPILGMGQPHYTGLAPQSVPHHLYQAYMYQTYQQSPPNMGAFHA
jgi:protein JSN1